MFLQYPHPGGTQSTEVPEHLTNQCPQTRPTQRMNGVALPTVCVCVAVGARRCDTFLVVAQTRPSWLRVRWAATCPTPSGSSGSRWSVSLF
ncbi:hypothetical protein FKM82_025164 [Ascaphus truei]